MQVIYVDVLFLINFSADFLVLSLGGRLLHLDIKRKRLFFASILGALLGVFAVLYLQGLPMLLFAFAVLVMLVMLVYRVKTIRAIARACMTVLFLSALEGGLISLLWRAVEAFLASHTLHPDTGGKPAIFLLLIIVGCFAVYLSGRLSGIGHGRELEAVISLGLAHRQLRLLVDSGSFLREPMTGRAVIVLTRAGANGILPSALIFAKEGELPSLSNEEKKRYYAVPYRTVGGKRLLHGYRPDLVELKIGKECRAVSAILAISPDGAGKFHGCDGILPSGILE